MKFIEAVGSSTQAFSLDTKRRLGHWVGVSAYEKGDKIVLRLENQGSRIAYISDVEMSKDDFQDFKYDNLDHLTSAALSLFPIKTMFN